MKAQSSRKVEHFPYAVFDIVAMAASAGGLAALSGVLADLPGDFPAAIVIVQHLDPRHRSLLADLLSRRTSLRVKEAEDNEPLRPSTVYIAPPDRHLLVSRDGTLKLSQAAQVHFVRPSADLLFDSVATHYQDRALAVVLSGAGQDGAAGVRAIKNTGGKVIAQDEDTAEFFGMPGAAIESGNVDWVLPLDAIPAALVTLVREGERT